MFYCKDCAKKNDWPSEFYLPRSRGRCEICHKTAVCFEVHSASPRLKIDPEKKA